jgi:hypothetical protein
LWALVVAASFWTVGGLGASTLTLSALYRTGFEASEGYSTALPLVRQQGWVGAGSGGNGIGVGLMPGPGQQAWIGYSPPQPGDLTLFVFHPLNRNVSRAQFSVMMAVADSTNGQWDDFYWSLFNQHGDELFALDLDNYGLKIYYYVDGTTNRIYSGVTFTNGGANALFMDLDFANNRWGATFNATLVATNKPITTTGRPLDLGDIDAAWVIFDTNAPGDNYLAFDNYQVTGTVPQPQLRLTGMLGQAPIVRLTGQSNTPYAIEASTNFFNWLSLKTNSTVGSSFDFIDSGATGLPRRFYRGRWVP